MQVPMSIIRHAGMNLLPPDGGWVVVRGNPYAARGLRILGAIRDQGVTHFSIYYAYDEGCPWKALDRLVSNVVRDLQKGVLSQSMAKEFVLEEVLETSGIPEVQLTWVTLHTPSSQLIRFYQGELSHFSIDLISGLVKENCLEINPFGKVRLNPVWDEAIRDMIGSLQLDGLSFQEAQAELVKAGEKFQTREPTLPDYFYKPAGWLYDRFCEEPEYEEYQKELQYAEQD